MQRYCHYFGILVTHNTKTINYISLPSQVAAFEQLKDANPNGRFWLKLDATDLKGGLMESYKGVWNGDVDLGDGQVKELRRAYDGRVSLVGTVAAIGNRGNLEMELRKCVDSLDDDIHFLEEGFRLAVDDYRKKFDNRPTPEEKLKNTNSNVVEFQTLLQQAQQLKGAYERQLSYLNPGAQHNMQAIRTSLRGLDAEAKCYLRNLYKKKRTAATHVFVLMLSDERRNKKPYALPIRYVPYRSLRDQYVRDLTRDVKVAMQERGLNLVGQYFMYVGR